MTKKLFEELFLEVGNVLSSEIVVRNGHSLRIGFVKMATVEEGKAAIERVSCFFFFFFLFSFFFFRHRI